MLVTNESTTKADHQWKHNEGWSPGYAGQCCFFHQALVKPDGLCKSFPFTLKRSRLVTQPGKCSVLARAEQGQPSASYTTWPKVCGHLLVKHLIPKSWALIWSWSPLCCYNSLHSSGKASTISWNIGAITASTLLGRLSTRCWNIGAGTCASIQQQAH